ncbi:MAG: ribosome silencing factor [Rhodospirillaceae bacterium]|nr:ribosome silencing factor [Rhodospirillaceae bacterium]
MLQDDKAEDVTVLDLIGKTSIADHMIIASGRSARHVTAIADHIIDRLKEAGVDNVSVEGRQQADWILLDVGDVIIHLFRPEIRAFYNLEKMWAVPLPENISR